MTASCFDGIETSAGTQFFGFESAEANRLEVRDSYTTESNHSAKKRYGDLGERGMEAKRMTREMPPQLRRG
jgi:hypothetical protein